MTLEATTPNDLSKASDPNCPTCGNKDKTQEAALGCANIDSYVVTNFDGSPFVYCGFKCADGSVKERGFGSDTCPTHHIF